MWTLCPRIWRSKEGEQMKKNFEEPKLVLETFCVADILTTSGWENNIKPGEDELPPIGGSAIGGN